MATGAIQFNQVPANIRVPFVRIEVNAGQAPYQSISRLLLIGLALTGGAAPVNYPVFVNGQEDGLFGKGSMLAAMCKVARANGPFQEIWGLPLAAPSGAVAATGKITVTGTVPLVTAGTIILYVGGLRVAVPVTTLMTAANIATAIAAAINACPGIEVTAAVNGSTTTEVDLTAICTGTLGNTILILTRLAQDDGLLADQILTIVPMASGASDPDIATPLANLGDDQWDFICCPWADSTHLDEVDAFLANRWSPISQRYGLHITAKAGTAGTIMSFTSARNSQFSHIMPMLNGPNPIYALAAAVACQAAVHLQAPPELSRPLQTVELVGIRPPKNTGDWWSIPTRQSFYYDGASGYVVQSGVVQIDRLVSTYQRDAYGNADQSWLDINTMAQLMYGLRSIASYITETYPRAALVNSNPDNLQGFVTVQDIANAMVHAYKSLQAIGVFQDADIFQQLLVVERNAQDPNRVDCYLPLEGVNALRILAINATSYLQYPTS